MTDETGSTAVPEPPAPNRLTGIEAWRQCANANSQLLAAVFSSLTVLFLAISTYQARLQARQSAEQFRVSADNMARQINQAVFAVSYQEFIHCIEHLEHALSATQHEENYTSYEPVVITPRDGSLFLQLSGGSESPIVVDENFADSSIRVRIRGAIAVCRPVGGSEPVFQVASTPEQFLSYYQRAKKLGDELGDAVVASQYLTLARFSLAYSGFDESERYLQLAVRRAEQSEDGPGKAIMLGQIAAIRVKYQKGTRADEGRSMFRVAVKLLRDSQSTAATTSLVSVYKSWVEAEYRAQNVGQAEEVTQLLFAAIGRLPVKQTIKNQHVIDAAAAILVEMELAAKVRAELPVPDVLRFPTKNGDWKALTAADLDDGLTIFTHTRIPVYGDTPDLQTVLEVEVPSAPE